MNTYEVEQSNFMMACVAKPISPIIMSVPHDGAITMSEMVGMFGIRDKGVKARDRHVWPVVKDILLTAPVNTVRGLLSRHFIDYNRAWPEAIQYYPHSGKEPDTALDDDRLAVYYHAYHNAISSLIERTIQIHGVEKTILLDMHGYGVQPEYGDYDVILGTGSRSTIRPGSNIDQKMGDFLTSRGYRTFVPSRERMGYPYDRYEAEFTTRHYAEKYSINVIQIETHYRFRNKKGRDVGIKLANDLADFINTHILS